MSTLPHPNEFRERFENDEELLAELPDRPITSLRDIQYLYGRLYTLATAGTGEYAAYLTPEKGRDLLNDPESLIAVQVDLSGEEPRLADDEPVFITSYKEHHVSKVVHCWYNSARGIDHSVTHRTGRDKPSEAIVDYLAERLTRWAADDVVQSVADNHEDGWIIDSLATVGELDSTRERLAKSLQHQFEGTTTALIPVRVKFAEDGDYLLPGELDTDVFNAAMRARKLSKLVSKGAAKNSAGSAVDLLTGVESRTVGTAEDPLNYYLGKQLETFPGLDADEAWRTHPVSEDAAVTLMNAEPFVEACTYSTFGATVYYLPYFLGKPRVEGILEMYAILHELVEQGDGRTITPVERAFDTLGSEGIEEFGPSLRFYVTAIQKHQSKRFDVFGDTLDARIMSPVKLAEAHVNALGTWVFEPDEGSGSPPLPSHEKWPLTDPNASKKQFLGMIAGGGYFYRTFASGDDDQDASADDPRLRTLVSVLAGDPIEVETLLRQYVAQLIEGDWDGFPSFQVASQYAQLCALAARGLLKPGDRTEAIALEPNYERTQTLFEQMHEARADGGQTVEMDHKEKLEQFIKETPALNPSDSNEPTVVERRCAFLLGVVVGQLGKYQSWSEDRSTTVVDQYPVKALTKTNIKRLAADVLGKNITYTTSNRNKPTVGWYIEAVESYIETALERDPDDWQISLEDLRFYYALGVTYGMNDRRESNDEQTESEE
jgi:CRISPR-associated protein Cas8b/Csh1 subtype I-B